MSLIKSAIHYPKVVTFASAMPRCMDPDQILLGAMGVDPPCSGHHQCQKRSLAHRMRQARFFCNKYIPAAVTSVQLAHRGLHAVSQEGIGIGVLARAINRELPSRETFAHALQVQPSPEQLLAWESCRCGFGLKAARYNFDHALRYGSHNPNHLLALHRAFTRIIGPVHSVDEMRAAVRQGILATRADYTLQRGLQGLSDDAKKGRARLNETLMVLYELIQVPAYQQLLLSPEMRTWGQFTGLGQRATVFAVTLGLAIYFALHPLTLAATILGTTIALVGNEMRLFMRDFWSNQPTQSCMLFSWLFAERYTGKILT